MPKRKRGGDTDATWSSNDHVLLQRQRAIEKLHHGKKVIHRALKLARGFERQKLGRRQKAALKQQDDDPQAAGRINCEIKALKALDLAEVAQIHLYKTVLKVKRMKESPALPDEVLNSEKPVLDKPTANVTARLFMSKPVKEAMTESIAQILAAMGLEQQKDERLKFKSAAPKSKSKVRTEAEATALDPNEDDDSDGGTGFQDDLSDPSKYDAHIASQSDSDRDPQQSLNQHLRSPSTSSTSNSDNERPDEKALTKPKQPETCNHAKDLSLSASPTPSTSRSSSPAPRPQTKPSQFLPSLTTHGYISGSSDSEIEDLTHTAPRKNRRGQRARQAIWEKKYGAKAKHLAKGGVQGKRDRRDEGWDMKRGAIENNTRQGKGYKPGWAKGRASNDTGGIGSGGNAVAIGSRKEKEKPLHPSWVAAKKAKEMGDGGGMKFAGQKISLE